MQPFGRNGYGPKIGGCAPLGEGELGPRLTHGLWAEAYPATTWHIDASSRWPQWSWAEKHLFGEGEWGPLSNTKSPGPRPTSIPSGILIYAAIWLQRIWAENWGDCVPLGEGELGPHLTQCGQGRGLLACRVLS